MYYYFILFLLLNVLISAQSMKVVKVDSVLTEDLFIEIDNLIANEKGEISVWVEHDYKIPIIIESVKENIHSSKTKYLFNSKTGYYAIEEISYFNKDGKNIKNFNYFNDTDLEQVKYNYPMMKGSNEYYIYLKINEIFKKTQEKDIN